MAVELVYCADGNRRFAEIAMSAGFRYGAQLPNTIYAPLWFADQNWRRPNLPRYVAAVREHRPDVATVLDWERNEQLSEVLAWAEEISPYVRTIVIIPKVSGVERIPRSINGCEIRLGYSVPTAFGATSVPVWEFCGWPVHLLGGSPHRQMELAHYLDVQSADGNFTQKMAVRYCQFWMPGTARWSNNRYWPKLSEIGDKRRDDAPYEAFRRSCENVMAAWRRKAVGDG